MTRDPDRSHRFADIAKIAGSATAVALFSTTIDVLFRPAIESIKESTFKIISGFSLDKRALTDMKPFELDQIAVIQRLLGIEPGNTIKLAGGRDHYLYPNVMHPDNQLAMHSLVKFMQTFRSDFELSDSGDFDPTGSFVCLGGPISNARTALFLGYNSVSARNRARGFRRSRDCLLQLGIEFEIDSAKLKRLGLIAKRGIHNDPTPQWALRLRDGSFLETRAGELDYLLISRVPNWVEHKLFPERNHHGVITIFAGCHGAGMNAVQLLLRDKKLLKSLDALTQKHQHWQALVRVAHIENEKHPITRTLRHMATSIEGDLVASFPIEIG